MLMPFCKLWYLQTPPNLADHRLLQEGGDAFKEDERKFRRAVFSFERWAAHRSTWRYLRHFRGIFSSRTLLGLLPAVAFFTGMAAIAGVWCAEHAVLALSVMAAIVAGARMGLSVSNTTAQSLDCWQQVLTALQPTAYCLLPTAGVYNTYAVDTGAPAFALSSTSLDITAFAVSLLLVFRWGAVSTPSLHVLRTDSVVCIAPHNSYTHSATGPLSRLHCQQVA
jgi:hypothetical protein